MAILSQKYAFTEGIINEYASDSAGVYALYNSNHGVIYYGKSDVSIRSRLIDHLSGEEGVCTQKAAFFNFESPAYPNPSSRERELLNTHSMIFGQLPLCNDRF